MNALFPIGKLYREYHKEPEIPEAKRATDSVLGNHNENTVF